jgi:glutaconate CoA-transferase subunit B
VEQLDFLSSVGYGRGKGDRERLGLSGKGPATVITDLGVLRPDPETSELTLTEVHPGVSVDEAREACGWELRVADDVSESEPPTEDELRVLRELKSTLEKAVA